LVSFECTVVGLVFVGSFQKFYDADNWQIASNFTPMSITLLASGDCRGHEQWWPGPCRWLLLEDMVAI
jgi:hypothetical protein